MPCKQQDTDVSGYYPSPFSGPFATEADCLSACKEGACCNGSTCSVLPKCQCQGTGQTFKGVGTTCTPNPCDDCAGYCSPYPVHPITLSMEISGFTGPTPAKFAVNTSRSIARLTDGSGGSQSCWAYTWGMNDIGDACPNPIGQQGIDGIFLMAIFSTEDARFFANYRNAAGDCHRYDIKWKLTADYSAQRRLCEGDFPFTGTITQQGVSFSYRITANPLP